MKSTIAATVVFSVASGIASAGTVTIDFDGFDQGTSITDQFAAQGVLFNGDILQYSGVFTSDDPFIGDVEGLIASLFPGYDGSPDGSELVAPPDFDLNDFFAISAAISVEATEQQGSFANYEFEVVRRADQHLTLNALTANDDLFTLEFPAPSTLPYDVEVFSVDLDNLFGNHDWVGLTVNDSGGQFGFTTVTAVVPMPHPSALAAVGLAGIAVVRRRRTL